MSVGSAPLSPFSHCSSAAAPRDPRRHLQLHRLQVPLPSRRTRPAQSRKRPYIYGFPIVDNYRIQYSYFVNKEDPEYKGGWNEVHSTARVYTPEDKAVQTPNSDTPYSMLGADLRTEPLVLTVPPIEQDRYYSLQFVDGYTYNFAYVGSRTTGNGGGKYLLAGPNWKGNKPEGVNEVIQSDTDLAQERTSPQFFEILDFALRFAPTLPSEKDLRARFATIGVGPDGSRRRQAEPRDAKSDRRRDGRCLG